MKLRRKGPLPFRPPAPPSPSSAEPQQAQVAAFVMVGLTPDGKLFTQARTRTPGEAIEMLKHGIRFIEEKQRTDEQQLIVAPPPGFRVPTRPER